jgi:hypothetical protein
MVLLLLNTKNAIPHACITPASDASAYPLQITPHTAVYYNSCVRKMKPAASFAHKSMFSRSAATGACKGSLILQLRPCVFAHAQVPGSYLQKMFELGSATPPSKDAKGRYFL